MNNKLLYMLYLLCFLSFFSCSQEYDITDDYLIEIELQDSDTIIAKDTTNVPPKDSTYIPKDTTTNNGQGTTNKDTVYCSYEKHMNISTSFGIGQGGACYDKYFFQGYSNNAAIGVFDLEKKTCLGKIDITEPKPSSKIHVNTMNFGIQKYDKDDYFPLLYVSSGYTVTINKEEASFIYVYRIIWNESNETFSASLIQTITIKGLKSWTEGILDNDHNILWIKNGSNFYSYHIPDFNSGDIEIWSNNYLEKKTVPDQPFTSSNQGHLYYKDRILLVSGILPTTQKLAFIVINLKTQTRELVIDLAEIGLRSEPENLFFYKDQLMIGYQNAIYKFTIKNFFD